MSPRKQSYDVELNKQTKQVKTDETIDFKTLLMNSNESEKVKKKMNDSGDLSSAKSYEDFLQSLNRQTEKRRLPKSDLDKNDFLKLFITQLQNQDPLKPKDGTEMASQLAQFNGLEQMMNVNKTLEKLESSSKESQNFNLINTVGKEAFIKTGQISVADGKSTELEFESPMKTDSAKVKIKDVNGKAIIEKELGIIEAGKNTFTIDPKDIKGNNITDGRYSVSLSYRDKEGVEQNLDTSAKVKIDGIDMSGEDILLETAIGKKSLSEIRAIRNPEEKETTTEPAFANIRQQDLPQGGKLKKQNAIFQKAAKGKSAVTDNPPTRSHKPQPSGTPNSQTEPNKPSDLKKLQDEQLKAALQQAQKTAKASIPSSPKMQHTARHNAKAHPTP